jgi:predicted RNase H-like nuclease (RuvC/YqgF family)
LLKSSEIKAISDLNSSLTSNIISLKALTDFKSICRTIIKNNIKDILEKIDKNIDELKTSINNINSIHNDVKDKLSNKDIPGDVFNESINPLNKYLEDKKKKMENLEKIKSEINKIYLKINNC